MSLTFEWDQEKAAGNFEKKGARIMSEDRSHKEDMLPEYDFSNGERGKYAKHYADGANVVMLSPDVAEAFPNAEAVNNALRALMNIARQNVAPAK
jgi:hypothetical protein